MMKNLYKIFFLTFLIWAEAFPFGHLVYDPTACGHLVSEVRQMEQQTTALRTQLLKLSGGQYNWSNAQNLIDKLGDTISASNALGYKSADLSTKFKKVFPGYTAPSDFPKSYKDIIDNSQTTIGNILNAYNLSANDFADKNKRLNFLQNQVQNSQGQMQAIQASAQISSEILNELQLIQQTLLAQANAESVYFSATLQKEANGQSALDKELEKSNKEVTGIFHNSAKFHDYL